MEITLCDPTCFFVFFKCQCEVWKHVTLCDPKQCPNVIEPVLACSNMPLNATLFKGDLLESYESPTIFAQSDIMCHWADVNKKEWNTCTKSNDFSSWCFRPSFCPTKWPNIATKWPNIDNVKTCTKSNLCRKHDFRWFFHHMNQRGGVF